MRNAFVDVCVCVSVCVVCVSVCVSVCAYVFYTLRCFLLGGDYVIFCGENISQLANVGSCERPSSVRHSPRKSDI